MTGEIKCGICGSAEFSKLYAINSRLSIVECEKCGLWLNWPLPSREEIGDMYRAYHEKWGVVGADEDMHRSMRRATFERLMDRVEPFKKPGASKLLDVGCATGICMEVAKERGWDVYGIDISEKAIETANKKFADRAEVKDLESAARWPVNFYDVVMMTDVLEHLKDARSAMEKVHDMLKPGGIVVIVTVDTGSLFAKFMGRYWVHIRTEHLSYFSRKNLMMLLKGTGFNPVSLGGSTGKSINLYYTKDYIRQTRKDFPKFRGMYLCMEGLIDCLPRRLKHFNFMIPTGDITGIAQKRVM